MGLVGREIVQSRIWLDPKIVEPNLNYKETFPITVFDAVKQTMDPDNTVTLTDVLNKIFNELRLKQSIIPGRPSNYLVTYAGVDGAVGAIQMSQSIPMKESEQRSDRIPSEKAVAEFLRKYGFTDDNGNPKPPDLTRPVRWSDIIGRPKIYEALGDNDDGVVTQKGITDALNNLQTANEESIQNILNTTELLDETINNHIHDYNNPHRVTIEQIGGVTSETFDYHVNTAVNPHKITAEMLGLGNVDNTRDIDKPISKATQEAIDAINKLISDTGDGINALNYVSGVEYVREMGSLIINYRNGDKMTYKIPIDGLVDEITYDDVSRELVVTELGGETHRVSLADLFIRYTGSVTSTVTVEIIRDDDTDSKNDGEITASETNVIWINNGEGEIIDTPDEITRVTVEGIWNTNGEGSTEAEEGEIKEDVVKYHWNTDGNGNLILSNPEGTDSGVWIIKASLNAKSITEAQIADQGITARLIEDQSITADKIKNLTITTIKYADQSITTEKIAELAVTNKKLASRSVNGRVLFTSDNPNVVLAVRAASTDPVWSKVNGDMIASNSIDTDHIRNKSITAEKLADGAIGSTSLPDNIITVNKIAQNTIINQHIVNNTIEGDKLITNIILPGTPSNSVTPPADSNDNTLANTQWIRDMIKDYTFDSSNLADRSVLGNHLFSSATRERVLVVHRAGSDPVWDVINNAMLDINAVGESNIIDKSVTENKIADNSVGNNHLKFDSVKTENIVDGSIVMEKIMTSHTANRVLAAIKDDGHPIYTQINKEMMGPNSVSTANIEDHSIIPAKLQPSDISQRILATGIRNTDPIWTQVTRQMMGPRSVAGEALFSSSEHDVILGVTTPDADPAWLKVNSGMIGEKVVKREHIGDGEVWGENIHEKAIESKHILDWTIQSNNVAPRAITGTELFTSPMADRILAVAGLPYSDPVWMQLTTEMIEDKAVTKEKLFQSEHPYRVLATSQAGVPPEYIKITGDYIVDDSIMGEKLLRNIALPGSPSLTTMPPLEADDNRLANTKWVKLAVADAIDNFNPDLMFEVINSDKMKEMIRASIDERSIDGSKLFTSDVGPRVLGVTAANEDVEFLLINEDLLSDGAVTTNKIQRDVHLLGSPVVEVRPAPQASDAIGGGSLIPDCQWVLDRIAEGGGGGSSSGGGSIDLVAGSVITDYIQDRAVTGKKLFTSVQADRLLTVGVPNTDPTWGQLTSGMIQSGAVGSDALFKSTEENVVLSVTDANSHPTYTKVLPGMIGDKAVLSTNIADRVVQTEHIADGAITKTKLTTDPIIETSMILDNAVTNAKIADGAVDTRNIIDSSVTSEKLSSNIQLNGQPTVSHNDSYKNKSLRNITLSQQSPTGGVDGDIWFQYI